MQLEEAKDYINSHPKEYLHAQHGIVIKGRENSKCPVCGGSEKSGKFSIRDDNKLHCFACGFHGDVLDLIAQDHGLDVKRAFRDVVKAGCEIFGLSLEEVAGKKDTYHSGSRKAAAHNTAAEPRELVLKEPYDFTAIIRKAQEHIAETTYFHDRGFSDELIERYCLGYSPKGYNALLEGFPELQTKAWQQKHYQYVIPILNADNTCRYFLVRATSELKEDKYNKKVRNMKNPEGRNPVKLFNERYLTEHKSYGSDPVFLVEGWADALSVEEAGFRAVALNSVSNVRKVVELCRHYRPKVPFVVALDQDKRGQQASKMLTSEMREAGFSVMAGNLAGSFKDANEFFLQDRDGFQKAINGLAEKAGSLKVDREWSSPITVHDHSYYVTVKQGERQITNFVMRPLCLIQGTDSGSYTIEFTLRNGKVLTKQFKSSAFSNARTFKQILNRESAEFSFMGGDNDLEQIKMYMLKVYSNHKVKKGIDYTGLFKQNKYWLYVGYGKTIDGSGHEVDEITTIAGENAVFGSNLPDVPLITAHGLEKVSGPLFQFNTYSRTIPIIGWCVACFLKRRLNEKGIKLSHLFIHGTAGSGKTDTENTVIREIFSLKGEPLSCGKVKEFALLKACSSSNLLPLVLDEYKPARMGSRQINLISETLRSAYDGHTVQRGNPDQTVTNYQYRAPIVIIGESSTDEKAIKERSIEVLFGKADRTNSHTEQYCYLKKDKALLNQLGKRLLIKAINLPDDRMERMIVESRMFQEQDFETRNITGLSTLCLGLQLLQELYEDLGLDFFRLTGLTKEKIKESLITNMKESLDERGRSKSAIEQILEVFDLMAFKKIILSGRDYYVNEQTNEIQLYLPFIYPEFSKYYKDYNLKGDVEYLDKNQFVQQLKKTEYFKSNDARTFCYQTETRRVKCFILNLDLVNQRLDMQTFSKNMEQEFHKPDNEDQKFIQQSFKTEPESPELPLHH